MRPGGWAKWAPFRVLASEGARSVKPTHQRTWGPGGRHPSPRRPPSEAPVPRGRRAELCSAGFPGQREVRAGQRGGSADSEQGRAVRPGRSTSPCVVFCSQSCAARPPATASSPEFRFSRPAHRQGNRTARGRFWGPRDLTYVIDEEHTHFKVYFRKKRKCFALTDCISFLTNV